MHRCRKKISRIENFQHIAKSETRRRPVSLAYLCPCVKQRTRAGGCGSKRLHFEHSPTHPARQYRMLYSSAGAAGAALRRDRSHLRARRPTDFKFPSIHLSPPSTETCGMQVPQIRSRSRHCRPSPRPACFPAGGVTIHGALEYLWYDHGALHHHLRPSAHSRESGISG